MAITIETAALTSAFHHLLSAMTYSGSNATFEVYKDGTTLVDSFTRGIGDFLATGGTLIHDGADLLFTIPPSTSNVDLIKLKGSFETGGAQYVSQWALASTPVDYTQDFPNGGTLYLSQYIMSAGTE